MQGKGRGDGMTKGEGELSMREREDWTVATYAQNDREKVLPRCAKHELLRFTRRMTRGEPQLY